MVNKKKSIKKVVKNKKVNKIKKLSNVVVSKQDLINRIWETTNDDLEATKGEIKIVVNAFLDEINNILVGGEELKLYGTFTLKTEIRRSYEGRNPQTSESIIIPTHYVPKCRFHPGLREAVAKAKRKIAR